MTKTELFQDYVNAKARLDGFTVMEFFQERYTTRFRMLDTSTGRYLYEVSKNGTDRRYNVRIRVAKFALTQMFSVIEQFCPCPRFQMEKNCHHCLLAIYENARESGMEKLFAFEKWAEFRPAKTYRKEIERRLVAA